MADIIDAVTGEIIEREDPNAIAERKLYELGVITDQTYDLLRHWRDTNEQVDMFKHVLKKAMIENDIKKWSNNLFSCSVTPEGTRQTFDSDRAKEMTLMDFRNLLMMLSDDFLKETSVYDYFQKVSYVKDKLNIRFKEDKYGRE